MSAPVQPAPNGPVPGRALGIAGLIVAFFFSVVGLVLSIVAKVQSRRAGVPNGIATAGIIVAVVRLVIDIVIVIVIVVSVSAVAAKCAELGPGTHQDGGVTYTCS